jgi:hypothetical protein
MTIIELTTTAKAWQKFQRPSQGYCYYFDGTGTMKDYSNQLPILSRDDLAATDWAIIS